MRSYRQVMSGEEAYSEVLFYRIQKKGSWQTQTQFKIFG